MYLKVIWSNDVVRYCLPKLGMMDILCQQNVFKPINNQRDSANLKIIWNNDVIPGISLTNNTWF
jgi:hypothetical protein